MKLATRDQDLEDEKFRHLAMAIITRTFDDLSLPHERDEAYLWLFDDTDKEVATWRDQLIATCGLDLEAIRDRARKIIGDAVVKPQRSRKRTHCPQGHPYAGKNLRVGPRGEQICRRCRCASDLRRRRKKACLLH